MKKIILIAQILVMAMPPATLAITADDRKSVRYTSVFYDPSDNGTNGLACVGSTGGAGGSDVLDGHRLPATKGSAAREQHLSVDADGGDIRRHYSLTNTPPIAQNGFAVGKARPRGALPTNDITEEQYYINMRWRYAKWAWSGASQKGPEDHAFYAKHPRVLVTNPRTGKSLIAAAVETGPAPWTGTREGRGNPPSYWQGYIDGTPPEYRGHVAGLSPESHLYLEVASRVRGEGGDDLLFAWAPDQTAKPGPVQGIAASGQSSACSAGAADFIKRISFPDRTRLITPTAVVLHWTGSSNPSADITIATLQSRNLSVQLTIDGEGKVYQLVEPLNVEAAHAEGINSKAIGIEIGGLNEAQLMANQTQFNAVVSTVVQLVRQYNIPLEPNIEGKSGILGHFQTDSASYGPKRGKSDPGQNYLNKVIEAVRQATQS